MLRRGLCAALPLALSAGRRGFFVDSPLSDTSDPLSMSPPVPGYGSGNSHTAEESYVYPLDTTSAPIKLFGETDSFANEDGNRIFASARTTSYDPEILYSRIRLQDVHGGGERIAVGELDVAAAQEPTARAAREPSAAEVEMREGRDKQGAAGAAAVAAAMLDARRAVDGIAMVPGHPLPVVFPKQDNLPPPLRFVKKFGGPSGRVSHLRKPTKPRPKEAAESLDDHMYGAVMQSNQKVEGHSLHRSIALQVHMLDEHKRAAKVRSFHHFGELSETISSRVMEGLAKCNFSCPMLVQSASIPHLIEGKDLLVMAPGGSGKTVCYAVTSLTVLYRVRGHGHAAHPPGAAAEPIVVVLCSGREDVQRTCAMYASIAGDEAVLAALFPTEKDEERQGADLLDRGAEVVVATPARLAAEVRAGRVSLSLVQFMVIDGVEKMYERSQGVQLEAALALVKQNPLHVQYSLWCMHITEDVERVCTQYAGPHVSTLLVTREEHTAVNVKQVLYPLPDRADRLACIAKLYERRAILKRDQVLAVCIYKENAEALAADLQRALQAPSSMVKFAHSGLRARKRHQLVQDFLRGDIRILVVTDVALRRMPPLHAQHVIHFDLPATTALYTRRVSHVAAASGHSHVLLTPTDARVPMIVHFIQNETGSDPGEEIKELVHRIERRGGDDDWSATSLHFNDSAAVRGKWRVRGKRVRQAEELEVETDEAPAAPGSASTPEAKDAHSSNDSNAGAEAPPRRSE